MGFLHPRGKLTIWRAPQHELKHVDRSGRIGATLADRAACMIIVPLLSTHTQLAGHKDHASKLQEKLEEERKGRKIMTLTPRSYVRSSCDDVVINVTTTLHSQHYYLSCMERTPRQSRPKAYRRLSTELEDAYEPEFLPRRTTSPDTRHADPESRDFLFPLVFGV